MFPFSRNHQTPEGYSERFQPFLKLLTENRRLPLKAFYFLCALLFSVSLSAQSWGAPKKDRCIANGIATYSARLANDGGKGWERAATTTSIRILGVNQGTPDRTSNQGLGGMWGEWDIKDPSCSPKWGNPKKDRCIGNGKATYSARLASAAHMTWDAAARTTSIIINGVNRGRPIRTSNQGVGGMWGEWDIPDNSCTPKWGAAKRDDCVGNGMVQYSARLASDAGMGWAAAARSTSIVINGVNQGPPKRTSNQGVAGGMWGEWDIRDNTCAAKWGSPKKDDCKGKGIVQYSARLASDAGMGWEAAAKSTSIVINGVNQGPPKRTSNQGVAGGMWGEWDIKDNTCVAKWGAAKKDDCVGNGMVQYSARLASDAGMGWEVAAKRTSIVINGVNQGPPKRTSNQGLAGGMWGEWDIKDDACVPKWQTAKNDGCKGIGIVKYSARLASDAGMGWEAAAKSTSIIINGVNQGPPKRTSDQGVGGMWGEWELRDATCVTTWNTPKKDDCIGDGIVQYSARLAKDAGMGWDAAAKMTSITINGVDQGKPDRTSNQGVGGMWGEWDVEDYTCLTEWEFFDFLGSKAAGKEAPIKVSFHNSFRGWSWDGVTASYVAAQEDGQGGMKSMLYIRKFDGKTFTASSYSDINFLETDQVRGWSWDGVTASYVIAVENENGGLTSTLIVRPFNGTTFGTETLNTELSDGDPITAWSWDGQEAKYIAAQGDDFLLYETSFDGTVFGQVSERVIGNVTNGTIKALHFNPDNLNLIVYRNTVTNLFLQQESPRNTGLLPNSDEDRAFVKKITSGPDEIPQPGSFVLDMPPIGSQGSEGSCLAWAVGYGLMSYEKHRSTGLPYTTDGKKLDGVASPEYLFNRINSRNDSCSHGSRFVNTITRRGGLNVLQQEGTVDWMYAPYDDKNGCGSVPNSQEPVNPAAAVNKITNFSLVQDYSQQSIKNLLNNGFPIAIAAYVSPEFQRAGEGFIWKQGIGPRGSGHAMVLMGYDDDKNAYKIQNSWDTGWGDDGYGWIDYEFFQDSLYNPALYGPLKSFPSGPYIVYTDKPVGYKVEEPSFVTVYSEAGYVAKIELSYTINGIVKVVNENLSLFFTFRHALPEGASDVQLKVDGVAVTDPLNFVKNFSGSKINACYKIWGTIFDTRIGEIDCSY